MAFNKISSMLPRRLRQAGIERGVQAARIVTMADEVIDEVFGEGTTQSKAKAVSCKQRQLQIATMDASLKQEIAFKEKDIINRINEKIGEEYIHRIQVVI